LRRAGWGILCPMPKRAETVDRWVLADNRGHYAVDQEQSQFSEHLADAYVFVAKPRNTIAVHAVEVTLKVVPGAE